MRDIKKMTEAELREVEEYRPNTIEELNAYINKLVNRAHDYGTCVYAMSLASIATFNYVAGTLGVTGFQASCADLDFIKRTRMMKSGFRIIDYNKLLYPQYLTDEHFPSMLTLLEENKEQLKKQALELLKDKEYAHPDVIEHWKKLAS